MSRPEEDLLFAIESAADAIEMELRKTARGDHSSIRRTLSEIAAGFRTLVLTRARESADAKIAETERINRRTQSRFRGDQ